MGEMDGINGVLQPPIRLRAMLRCFGLLRVCGVSMQRFGNALRRPTQQLRAKNAEQLVITRLGGKSKHIYGPGLLIDRIDQPICVSLIQNHKRKA